MLSFPLQGHYRNSLYDEWISKLETYNVPHTKEPNLIGTLGDPVKIRSWQVILTVYTD